jgi:glycosyltransferase involved in cell wall biosynthesis
MNNAKFAFVSFFEVFPVNFGSSVVCSSLYKYWPYEKKYFQLSNKKNFFSNVVNISYLPSNFGKLLAICKFFFLIKKYLNVKKSYLIIEGASWVGYSFFLIFLVRIFLRKIKIIYKTHSVEYEIRKNNSNFFITLLTKVFEKKVLQFSNLSTAVSNLERRKFVKYYSKKTFLFYNTIDFIKVLEKKKSTKNYIYFSGSEKYKPNSYSIEQLVNYIMPAVRISGININLYIFGNKKLKYSRNWLKVKKPSKLKYIQYLKESVGLVVPSNESYGSKVKIIESLCHGVPVITSKIGFSGIKKVSNKLPIIANSNSVIVKKIIDLIKNKEKYFLEANKISDKYIEMHDIKKNIYRLIKKIKQL